MISKTTKLLFANNVIQKKNLKKIVLQYINIYHFIEVNGQGSSSSQSFYKELFPVAIFGLKYFLNR